ncbi:MAG: ABC transporter ATP-binding protein [Herpetosiphonaceae bacterium]|nr:ABC transporter ATP-binding protein [Herpetosiphonaceae bacterium]
MLSAAIKSPAAAAETTATAIRTTNLTKTYGKQRGIIDLSLEVHTGEVFGFLGPNGAGKTTTIRTLLDFIRPSSGSAQVLGLDSHHQSIAIHQQVSYLPGELMLYEKMTSRELLTYFASLRGGVDWTFANSLAERLELDLKRPIRTLSKGNKQKVGLVQAFMSKPKLLILDEPTSGLDPLVQQEFNQMVNEVKADGRTIFLSSHLMDEVETICDRVGIIRAGELLVVDDVRSLKSKALRTLDLHFGQPVPAEAFASIANVRDVHVVDGHVHCVITGSVDALIKVAAQFELINIVSHEADLEEIFMTYYKGEANHAE